MRVTGTLSRRYIHIGLGCATCPHHPAAGMVPGIAAGPAPTHHSGTRVLGSGSRVGCRRSAWEEEEGQVLAVRVMLYPLTLGSKSSIWPLLVFNRGFFSYGWEDTPVRSCVTFSAHFAIVQYIRYLWSVFFLFSIKCSLFSRDQGWVLLYQHHLHKK